MEDNEYHDNAFVNDSLQYVSTPINNSIYFWDDWNFLNISDHDDSDTNGSVGAVSATSSPQLTIRLYPPEESPVPTSDVNNYWGLLALVLVFGTAAGNILVCLAIAWERRLQNVTNYFLMSLAITDLMVAVLVMPLGILTLVYGYFPLQSEHCLVWICLDVLFCTASIMHLCTISVDRYLSLRYPMKFGRNKTRRRVTLKIIFVWLLSIAMSLPLSLMYSQDHSSVLVKGTCQIPDPVYKLVGSIVCFYIPLGVMLLTYYLTVRLLAQQRQNLGGSNHHPSGWASGWLGQTPAMERRCTWRRLLKAGHPSTPNHAHSATSTDTELSTLDTHELWLPDSSIPEPTPSTMTALHQFGAEMLKLSRGLESVGLPELTSAQKQDTGNSHRYHQETSQFTQKQKLDFGPILPRSNERTSSPTSPSSILEHIRSSHHRRSRSTWTVSTYDNQPLISSSSSLRKRYSSLPNGFVALHQDCNKGEELCREYGTCKSRSRKDSNCSRDGENVCYGPRQSLTMTKNEYLELPPPCTCPYFGDRPFKATPKPTEVKIISSTHFQGDPVDNKGFTTTTIATTVSNLVTGKKPSTDSSIFLPLPATPVRKLSYSKTASVVTWDSCRNKRRGSSFGGVRTSLLLTPTKVPTQGSPLRRSATLRNHNNVNLLNCDNSKSIKTTPSSPCLMQRNTTVRSHHSRNSSVISRNSSRHGRIIRLEQKATKVLGVVFFTFVILWAPFFVLNLLPTVCGRCEENISHWVFDVVTWLGYASSMVNPIFYTIFNKVFRQAFKKVLMCRYGGKPNWRPNR